MEGPAFSVLQATTWTCFIPSMADEREGTGQDGQQSDGAGRTAAIVPSRSGGPLVPSDEAGIALQGSWKGWHLSATGLYAGAGVGTLSLVGLLTLGNPLGNPQQFILAMLACFAAGGFFIALATRRQLSLALHMAEAFRTEMNRLADRKEEVERRFLERRLSSRTSAPDTPTPPNTPPPPETTTPKGNGSDKGKGKAKGAKS